VSRYLVTGCAGFIGSHLTEALLGRGDEVLGVDAFTDYYERETKERNLFGLRGRTGFSFREADLSTEPLAPLVEGVKGVFHLAAQPGVRGSWGDTFAIYTRDNVIATQRLFEAAARAGVRVVFASSSSVYGNAESYPTPEDTPPRPASPYGVTKLTCEHLASTYSECFGLDVVALRYFTVYGPQQRPDMAFTRIAHALANGNGAFRIYGKGEQSRDFTYVRDAVAATVASMDAAHPGAIYNVGGGQEATLNEVIRLCERLCGRRLGVTHEPSAAGDVRRTASDTARIRADLGWRPQTPLEEGLYAQLAWAGAVSG
jgi:UDP-glucuronate 4-epimerase